MNASFYYHIIYQNIKNDNLLILRDQSQFKINDLKLAEIENFSDFFQKYYSKLNLFKSNRSFLICTGCGSLTSLENHFFTDDIIEYVNLQGLDIYLYEDLYINYGPVIKNLLEGPTADKEKYYSLYGSSIRGFETTERTLKTLYSFELESIKIFIKNNNLKNVTVYCGDYNAGHYFQKKYPMMKIKTENICMVRFFKNLSEEQLPEPKINDINYRFISLNNSYKAHRHLTAAYLLDKSALLSFDRKKAIHGKLKNHLWFDLDRWKKIEPKIFSKISSNLTRLDNIKTITLDQNNIPDSNFNDQFNYAPADYFSKSFCAVITETKFSQPTSMFSEKTLNAINRLKPFILIGTPQTLEYLRSYGFKTFSSFWDESYDVEENHEKRLIKIFKLIDYLDSLPLTTLKNMYKNMKPILEHNFYTIKEVAKKYESE